jgi:hypothetical protein
MNGLVRMNLARIRGVKRQSVGDRQPPMMAFG